MTTKNLTRRLERLEACLAPSSDEPALVIRLTGVGHPDQIIEMRGTGRPTSDDDCGLGTPGGESSFR